jgi:threonine synthase
MAKVYVAGKELNRARKVIDLLRRQGHDITYDWATNYTDDKSVERVMDELNGVRNADVLVYLWESDQESARYETGMAMGLGKKIVISGGTNSFFFKLPNIYSVASDDEIIQAI